MSGIIEELYAKEENKIDVEETSFNFDCVKKEPKDEFENNGDILKYENFGETSNYKFEENKDNLVDFVDNAVIMEHTIKLENIKDEFHNNFHCDKCNGIYKGFCLTCSTLLCILNDYVSLANSKLTNIPADILEIKETSTGKGVFLLKTLPKDVIFGPFEGISGIKTIKGSSWKIHDNKLLNADNSNWMKYVCASNALFKNLSIFQMDDSLYFQTIREIMEGEELLVYFADEEIQKLVKNKECLYTPRRREKLLKIFACTLCCLGFSSDECLIEHKKKCPRLDQSRSIKDFELIECQFCNIWLEKLEHEEYHNFYCSQKHQRLCHIELGFQQKPAEEIEENQGNSEIFECDIYKSRYFHKSSLGEHIRNQHSNTNGNEYKCSKCSYQTNTKCKLKQHLNSHTKPFECDLCKKKFSRKNQLNMHIRNQHTNTSIKERLNDIKKFECDICKKGYRQKKSLKEHVNNHHSNKKEKAHKCPHCSFQTNRQRYLRFHLNRHNDIKPFECDICKIRYLHKNSLNTHMINQHLDTSEKAYKCTKCPYETNMERQLKLHFNRHDGIRPFECYICKKGYNQKSILEAHIKSKHLNIEIKLFECDVCKKKYFQKGSLKEHIRDQHSNTNEKKYKCSECSYQTNHKSHLKRHCNTHNGIKPFECIVCKVRCTEKRYLDLHTKNKHSNKSEK